MNTIQHGRKNIIQNIFSQHFEEFKSQASHLVPKDLLPSIIENVNKMIHCKDINKGFARYLCLECYETVTIGFSCKSRFCNSCGKVYTDNWIEKQKDSFFNSTHRHITMTLPDKLWNIIYKNFYILDELAKAAFNVFEHMFLNKAKIVKPAIILVIHTFGRALNFNPHFHLIVAQGGFKEDGSWKNYSFFPYHLLRKSWQKLVLDTFKNYFPNSQNIKNIINKLYNQYKKGFYVHGDRKVFNTSKAAQYIGRYLARPAIAAYRITDFSEKKVTFWYEDHHTNEKETITMNVVQFIGKLTYHIPPKHFKMVKRFGAYSRNPGKKFKTVISEMKGKSKKLFLNSKFKLSFAERFKISFGIDPLICRKCNSKMTLWEIWHHKYGSIFDFVRDETFVVSSP